MRTVSEPTSAMFPGSVTQDPAYGELCESCGLSDAGGTDKSHPAAVFEPAIAGDEEILRETGDREAPCEA